MNEKSILKLLRITSFLVFASRAWQHLFWATPWRRFFWNPKVAKLIAPWYDLHPIDYFRSTRIDSDINTFIHGIGLVFIICAISVLFHNGKKKWTSISLCIGIILLFILQLLYWEDARFRMGMLIELSSQTLAPIALMLFLKNVKSKAFEWTLRIGIALTFIGHGFYAVGIHPVPGNFQEMTIKFFGIANANAKSFLWIVGILDFIIGIICFLPFRNWMKSILYWAIFWGFITALMRIIHNVYLYNLARTLSLWVWEFLVRTPHYTFPLLWLFLANNLNTEKVNIQDEKAMK
jgi:hypothetical protein